MTQGEFWITNSSQTREAFLKFAEEYMEEHPYVVWEYFNGRPITGTQNAALHVYFRLLSKELNSKDFSVMSFFKEGYEMPFSEEIVKDHLWRPVQKAVAGVDSTQSLTTIQAQEVYEHLNRTLASKGVHVPWPEKKK